jgi:hypothetical protein
MTRTAFVEGFEAGALTTIIRFRGDHGINLVREFCSQIDSLAALYAAKDISEEEHARIHVIAEAIKARAIADNRVTAPDFSKLLGV